MKKIITPGGVEMVQVPAGRFLMGDSAGEQPEMPVHEVRVDAFYMDIYEVTQQNYLKIMGSNPSKFGGKDWKQYPVDRISFRQAAIYCNERSRREGLQACYDEQTWRCDFSADGYRLPTEAEWEYACRAGEPGGYYFGDDASRLARYAWFKLNATQQTHAVGLKKPNNWGLYDMAGNVYEWCQDFYEEKYYEVSPSDNPRGPEKGKDKVLRGGCWLSEARKCRSASRFHDDPTSADSCLGYPAYGLRCVKKISKR